MDHLTSLFELFAITPKTQNNLQFVGIYHRPPHSVRANLRNVEKHKITVAHAMHKYLYPHEIDFVINQMRRSNVTEDAILADFFDNNVEPLEPVLDEHFERGLSAMLDAFRPPQKCLPAHIYDVQHHYPYKWQVNAEAPFSTDSYFLANRPTFRAVFERLESLYTHLATDWHRRYGNKTDNDDFMNDHVPAKFGPMKETVFSWTHRWHHVIKSNFTDTAGLSKDYYFKNRYIFPMLLHTKTAIVKKDDPNKMRTIWGCSKPWIIADTMLWWEYVAYAKLQPGATPMLWSYETFTGGWLRLNHALFSSYIRHSYITLDWKRFDKKAYFCIIDKIFDGVETFLDFDNGYLPTKDYPDTKSTWTQGRSTRIKRLFDWTKENFYHAPIVLPNGHMYVRQFAGIPSGLFITQLIDSWYNYTMLATILSAMGFDPRSCIIKVQGDDSIIRLSALIPPDAHDSFLTKVQELADYYFQSVVSVNKSEVRNELNGCEVLSYRHRHGLPYRDELAMLAQLYHTKARNPSPEITMAQSIGFAYASFGNHERVRLVLHDIYEYYKHQGYTPNRAGLSLVFGNSPDLMIPHYTLDHFPTLREIKMFLTNANYANEETNSRTWPLNHFLSLPCHRT
ncbi:RNA-dependent RNA polymerase [Cherry chlorotic rusty spot associated partitivirus]|uniref:RNA-dependent RNA polymerase n=1 Tax=Cherry chlorotic rusty spot associated partitivirus TaxID=284688 RepID=Q65A70_9VIRU|nr:RNA-dependent RNA polymerase [Cherry chlorotic rusty spot associated partitivirus]